MGDIRFDDRVAIVTGAGAGLGKAYALLFAARGAKVVVNDVGSQVDGSGSSQDFAAAVVDEIQSAGGTAVASGSSVATPGGGAEVVETALEAFGRIDILVNNAGVLRDRTFVMVTPDELETVLSVHVKGAYHVGIPAFRAMRERNYGRIVNTSSAAGLFGNFGQASYATAKMGLVGLTHVQAIEGRKHGIASNVIAPGAFTRMTADLLGDFADRFTADRVAPVVAYLAHEECAVSGEIYTAAAGHIARVFVGETPGVDLADVTLEAVRDSFAQIRDEQGYAVPRDCADEHALILGTATADAPN